MIKSHPSEEFLYQFVAGDLSPALSLVMATHVDMCPHCQAHVADLEESICRQQFGSVEPAQALASNALDCNQMMAAIFSSSAPNQTMQAPTDSMICLEGKRFSLPPTLARNKDKIGPWSHMVGKLWRAPLLIGDNANTNLIYMAKGATVPEHTHKGQEATLVINGTFNDETSSYHDGDFVLLDGSHRHTPQTSEEDCLTLATLDAPLHFTSGVSRLLNPFSSLFFR